MKSAMISPQGSMSRLQGPRSLIGDGSPHRRTVKSVKFDKMDEVIQYIAASPDVSEDYWDQTFPESSGLDVDHRPLPSLPKFTLPPDKMEEKLNDTPRFQAKLGVPLSKGDDEFDFGSSKTSSASEVKEEDLKEDPRTILLSPLIHERSSIIDRPSLDVRMDAIMDGGSGFSPALNGSWHCRTESQFSDFSDGGNEAFFPVKQHSRPEQEKEDAEPASWRDSNDPSLARQDSLQDDQRHLPTIKLSEKPLPSPANFDRTPLRRKQKLLQMLDPHGAGVTQSQVIETIVEEAEEFKEENHSNPYKSPLDISLGDDRYWHQDSEKDGAETTAYYEADLSDGMTANQSIGISNEPAARYAAGLSKELDADVSRSMAMERPIKAVKDNFRGNISPISLVDSVHDRSLVPESSYDLDNNGNIEYIYPSETSSTNDMSQLTTPSRLHAIPNDLSYEASWLPNYDTTELNDLRDETPSRILDESLSNILLGEPPTKQSSKSLTNSSQESHVSDFEHDGPTVEELSPMSLNIPVQEEFSFPRVDRPSPKDLTPPTSGTAELRPRHNAYPGVLPWDPSMDTTLDNLAAMPLPTIPKKSPERKRRSFLLDRPLQSRNSVISLSAAPPQTLPEQENSPATQLESHTLEFLNQWKPEMDDSSDDDGTNSKSSLSSAYAHDMATSENEQIFRAGPINLSISEVSSPVSEQSADRNSRLAAASDNAQSVESFLPMEKAEANDNLFIVEKDVDADVLKFVVNQPDESTEDSTRNSTSTVSGYEKAVTLQKRLSPVRKESTASLRDKQSFVPLSLPSLSLMESSASPFLNSETDLKGTFAQQNRRMNANILPASVKSPLIVPKHANNSSFSSSVATETHERSILKDMSFNTAKLTRFQHKKLTERSLQELEDNATESVFPSTVPESQPVLDSDLSDLDDQNSAPRDLPESEIESNTQTSPQAVSPRKYDDEKPHPENQSNMEDLEANYSLRDGDVSIRRPSFGENVASTMMSLFSEKFEEENNDDGGFSLDRASSRYTYNLRESDSYVIATSPRRNRQMLSRAYEILGSDEPGYSFSQNTVKQSQDLPSNKSLGEYSAVHPPSDISKSGSSLFSMTRGSSSGSVPQTRATKQHKSEKAPLGIIEEPEEDGSIELETLVKVSNSRVAVKVSSEAATVRQGHNKEILIIKRSPNYETILDSPAKHTLEPVEAAQPSTKGFDRHFYASQASIPKLAGEILLPTPVVVPWVSHRNLVKLNEVVPAKEAGGSKNIPPIEYIPAPDGFLYLILDGVDAPQIPMDTLVSLHIDNGCHCIASKAMPASKLSQYRKEYRVGIMERRPVSITLKLSTEEITERKVSKMGCDGSIARFDLYPLRKAAFGNPLEDSVLNGQNPWGSSTKAITATAKLTALYIPRLSLREDVPQTLKGAVARISRAREEICNRPPLAQGPLRQYGGDLKSRRGKQRYLILDPVSPLLVVQSIRTRRPRTLINLAKATDVALFGKESFEIRFRNHGTLMFYAANSSERGKWVSALEAIVGRCEGARPKWVDAILYDSR